MDCKRIEFYLGDIIALAEEAKEMLGNGNTGVTFHVALDNIEHSVKLIREEVRRIKR